ncbi:MAG TPA: hypothetical protein VNB24_01825 [Acidimicrobiales bacterium]|nr:hypothetical protein [Acidimicrobiales bacterium]
MIALFVVVNVAACGGGNDTERTVLVDYSSDEYASFALENFPAQVDVTPGQTVVFKQTWTGEPHTVTGGTMINETLADAKHWLGFFDAFDALLNSGAELPNPEDPGDATMGDFVQAVRGAKDKGASKEFISSYESLRTQGIPLPDLDAADVPFTTLVEAVDEHSEPAFENIPFAFNDEEKISQNYGQPCYLTSGEPPKESDKPCSKANQEQPEFDGKQAFYNSGILPFRGASGNTFRVKLADDIKPGTYNFYCAVHGPGQLTEVVVKPAGSEVSSASEISRKAREEVTVLTKRLDGVFEEAVKKNRVTLDGEKITGPFAGLPDPRGGHTAINEFIPERITAKVNEPITWKMMGSDHTISFGVPKYFPVVDFTPKGVFLNEKISPAAGGAKAMPEEDDEGGGEGGGGEGGGEDEGPPKFDGGSYDGTGFWSSGLIGAQPYLEYTMRITKPGTYPYACLIHPPMIGRIVVTS